MKRANFVDFFGTICPILNLHRCKKLTELLRTYTPTQDFEIHYMYYDTIDDCLELQSKNEWVNTLNRFVKKHK